MEKNPLQNIQHQFKHLPEGIEPFLTALFEDEMPPRFNTLFDIQSYGYVYHPGGHFFHTLVLTRNYDIQLRDPFEVENVLKEIPKEIDEDVYLFWYYNFSTLHIVITGSN